LGIFTKSQVIHGGQGFQRSNDFLLQDQSAKLLPKERVCNCLKKRIDKQKQREVKYNENRKKAHYANVQRCGSIWSCPVCAKQITEKRREELKKGLETWKNVHRGSVMLLTLTFSHSQSESLKSLLERQRKAYKIFLETTKVKEIFKHFGVKYKIRSLEATYGQNGWHPHFHILLLGYFKIEDLMFRDLLAELWIKSCIRAGLNAPSMTHGLDLRDGTYADQYVSKWGIESELTKGHVKKGRNGGFTPFDLLQLSLYNETIFEKDCGKLFQEFAIAMKGSRQLVWSRGLKALLDLDEKTDEELAEETEKDAITLRTIDDFIFSLICHYQKRWDFLRCLERDYDNGCFGTGETEQLLIDILEKEHIRLGIAS
ncbi:protein rep, partial [Acinetobacter baumannii]|uniref:protein rep n=1 Tax=Acinetobacter baumannii TaxID=470 RepID=UPI001E5AA722